MVTLFPRLLGKDAGKLLDDFLSRPRDWGEFRSTKLPDAVCYAATGGSRVRAGQLEDLRGKILSIAGHCGFHRDGMHDDHAEFDVRTAEFLGTYGLLSIGEALRDDVWAFFGVVMFPDIVFWRFGSTRRRYLGGVRNAFQRLWIRARLLDRGLGAANRWQLLRDLTEDAFVQIFERPSIGADAILAREIAEAWVRAAARYGQKRMEPIMRGATLRVRIWNEITALSSLPSKEIKRTLNNIFDAAAQHQASKNKLRSGE